MQVRVTRRRLLASLVGFGGSLLTAACQPTTVERERIVEKAVEVTRIVEVPKEKLVERPVEVTRVVEKQVERVHTQIVEVTRVVEKAAGQTRLRLASSAQSIEGLQLLAQSYLAQNPNMEISMDALSERQYAGIADLLVSDLAPDVAWLPCTPARGFHRLIRGQALLPLDDLYKQEGWLDVYPQGALDFHRQLDKHYYSVNLSTDWSPVIYYNRPLFDRLSLLAPKTWDDLYALAPKLREAGVQPLAMDYSTGLLRLLPQALMVRCWSPDQYRYLPRQWRADAPAEGAKLHWTDREVTAFYSYARSLLDRQVLVDKIEGLTKPEQARESFTSGRAAMYQGTFADAAADSLPVQAKFELGHFYYPPAREDRAEITAAWVSEGLAVPAASANRNEALKFVAWAGRTPQAALFARTQRLPAGRLDLPLKLYGDALSATQLSIIDEVRSSGAPALFETIASEAYSAALVQSMAMLFAEGGTAGAAAAWMQQRLEEIKVEDQ